jgi:glycosyltransferase involved in cell wall biosynthesis
MKILQVNTNTSGGGAARSVSRLFNAYRNRGHLSWLAARWINQDDQDMFQIKRSGNPQYPWANAATFLKDHNNLGIPNRLVNWMDDLPGSWAEVERRRGYEDFNFPGSWHVLELPPERPDILHLHNLHGWYFDLRALPYLARKVPMTITLRDAWLLSGHCSHSFDCERWKIGCGNCPDLNIYPAVEKDATAYNWRRKQRIYSHTRLYITAPSDWLLQKALRSMMGPYMVKGQVIHNGVDRQTFRPGDRAAIRAKLEIPHDALVVMFASNIIRTNPYRDFATMWKAVVLLAEGWSGKDILFLAVGEDAPGERLGKAELRFVPYIKDVQNLVEYYQAADVYLHVACNNSETFPNTILEAHACGLPVVATATGGIPEQVIDGETGILVPSADAATLAEGMRRLLDDESLRERMGKRAILETAEHFDVEAETSKYLEWYQEVIDDWKIERACR